MVGWVILGLLVLLHLILFALAVRLGKKAGEDDWYSAVLVLLLPFVGPCLAIYIYLKALTK